MMSTYLSTSSYAWADPVCKALQMAGAALEPAERDQWVFSTSNGVVVGGTARLREEWFLMQAACPEPIRKALEANPDGAWALLARNAALRGGVRYGMNGSGQPMLLAELPLGRGLDLQGLISRALEGVRQAWHEPPDPTPTDPPEADPAPAPDWAALCAEAGWACAPRGTGDVAIDVGYGHGAGRVLLTKPPHPRARLTFGGPKTAEQASQTAMGRLLMQASGLIRLVRPVTTADGLPAFEYRWDTAPEPFLLGHVLEALSVAAQLCGGPLRALADARAAAAYLLHRGCSSLSIRSQPANLA